MCPGVLETERQVRCEGGRAYGYTVDLTDKQAVYRAAAEVKREAGPVSRRVASSHTDHTTQNLRQTGPQNNQNEGCLKSGYSENYPK